MPPKPGPIDPTQMEESERVERALPFQFTVAWTSVFDPLEAGKGPGAGVLANDRARDMVPAPAKPAPILTEILSEKAEREPVSLGTNRFESSSGVRWEMVVPKMVRTKPKLVIHEPAPRDPAETASTPKRPTTKSDQSVPNFHTRSVRFHSSLRPPSLTVQLLLAAAAAIAIAATLWMRYNSSPASPATVQIETSTQDDGWAREPVTRAEAGFNRSRRLVVFRPSRKAGDCRFEFDWKPDSQGIGWVFRANNTSNYYAMRINLLKERSVRTLRLEHLAVYGGVESTRGEKVFERSISDPVLRIRTEISGPTFTVYLGGAAVEYWIDTRLPSGGLGFFEERTQRLDVESVRMSFAPGTQIQSTSLRLDMDTFMKAAVREGA